MKVEFELTGEMEQYAPDIHMFVGLMLEKLQKNVHKGRWEHLPLGIAWQLITGEMKELRDELNKSRLDINIDDTIREAADVANFAMIIASIVQRGK